MKKQWCTFENNISMLFETLELYEIKENKVLHTYI